MAEYKKNDECKKTTGGFPDSTKPYADAENGGLYGRKMKEMELKDKRKEAFYVYPFGNIK